MRWRWRAAPAAPCRSTGRACRCSPACASSRRSGFVTGASGRNWAGYGEDVELPPAFAADDQALLTDPQTSGGLLVSCRADVVGRVLDTFKRHGFAAAAEIGEVLAHDGASGLVVR